ncbi:hypothetical protein [bacterium endosymbiont of Bathymodiolus sp. 5 South]|jgi:hypothetical protein|uniref:hypothetical protein n=1 Tax=bacterium endosymbiont of Bathymodiolus sp. 5 South TaxID=1181670 RepID=UPI001119E6AA|nr:hypothetical protein [bacterium endosymbiont of Bathymodiolus sp. 5 South]CAC9635036.1 hypothetical protein [uncultured Gammaproteobacteria bacterium]
MAFEDISDFNHRCHRMLANSVTSLLLYYSHSSFRFIVIIGFLLLTNKWIANHPYLCKGLSI